MSIDVVRDGRVALLTVNRPEVLNALSTEILDELSSELLDLARDRDVGAVVLTGAGDRAFIAGADIAELAVKTPLEARAYGELGQEIAHRLETMRKPTIAAVNGYALGGGCEMALACDVRLCAENAAFGQPEINLGIMPGWGGTQRLARTTSLGFAKEIIMTGRMISAEEAFQRGLVQAIYPGDQLVAKAMEMAALMAAKSPVAMAYAKEATNRSLHGDLGANFVHEADLFAILFSTEDAKEGLRAFTEKRPPNFIGR
jgi:enoyl-CoA hydratase